MKPIAIFVSASVMITSLLSMPAIAFGQLGHRIIGQIAQENLTPQAAQHINKLTQNETLAQLSTWADEIRSDKKWQHAAPWHYVSIADNETWDSVKRNPKGDIINSLEKFEKVLLDNTSNQQKKWQALAFYVHFIGDLHQPLHVGHSHDKGGNDIKLKWFGQHTNLHSVWDSKILEHQQLSYTEYTQFLNRISTTQKHLWMGKSYLEWASESKALRDSTYKLEKNDQDEDDLQFNYVFNNRPIIEKRLQQAGIRLAEKLNQIFN